MKCYNMKQDLLKIEKLLVQYINIIAKEYSNSCAKNVIKKISDGEKIVEFNTTQAISFFVRDGVLLLPQYAYSIFFAFKELENYGAKPNNHRNISDYLDTNTTYYEYINHLIESGMSVYDYFMESLLHEAMHICGSCGGTPLEEGINELKTRELAQKYNITIAAYGYTKEVEVAKRLQNIVGKEIMDVLTFVPYYRRKDFLSMKISTEVAELYELLSTKMIEKSKEFYDRIGQINDPFEKAKLYEEIDYSEIYLLLEKYSTEKCIHK